LNDSVGHVCPPARADLSGFSVWGDKDSDVDLVKRLAHLSPAFLGHVSPVKLVPRLSADLKARMPHLAAAIEYDRPDIMVTSHLNLLNGGGANVRPACADTVRSPR
jgi:hypothetical protein